MLGSLLGSLASVVSSSTPSETPSSASSSAPSRTGSPPAPSNYVPSAESAVQPSVVADIENDPFLCSAYFQRLLKRGVHQPSRVQAIKKAALADVPPREPDPGECCGGGCGLECVVTIWWEEEKTWRDMHSDWKVIKQRLKEEEEDRQREAAEEAALGGGSSVPSGDLDTGDDNEDTRKGIGAPKLDVGYETAESVVLKVDVVGGLRSQRARHDVEADA
ncbi:hypothetical protein JCM3770_000750 [Rhodotorula araucariae]